MGVKLNSFDQYGPAEWFLQLAKSDAFKDVVKAGVRGDGKDGGVGYAELAATNSADTYGISYGQTASEGTFFEKMQAAKDAATRERLYRQTAFFGWADSNGDGQLDPGSFGINDTALEEKMRQTWGSMDMWVFISNGNNDTHLRDGDGKLDPTFNHFYNVVQIGGKDSLQLYNGKSYDNLTPADIGLDGAGSDVVYQALMDKFKTFFSTKQSVSRDIQVWDGLSIKVNDHGDPSKPFAEPNLRAQFAAQSGASRTFDLQGLVTTLASLAAVSGASAYDKENALFALATNGLLAGATGIDFDKMTVTFPTEKADEFIKRFVGKDTNDTLAKQGGLDPYKGHMERSRQVFINDSGKSQALQEAGEITSSRHTYWKLDGDLNPTSLGAVTPTATSPNYGRLGDVYDNTLVLPLVHDDIHGARVLTLQELVKSDEQSMTLVKGETDTKLRDIQAAMRGGTYTLPHGLYPPSEDDMKKWLGETVGPVGGYFDVRLKSLQSVNSDAYAREQDVERENSVFIANDPHLLCTGKMTVAGQSVLSPYVTIDFFYQPATAFENFRYNDIYTPLTYEEAALLAAKVDGKPDDHDVEMRRIGADRMDEPEVSGKDYYGVRYDDTYFPTAIKNLDQSIKDGTYGDYKLLGKSLTPEGAKLLKDLLIDGSSRSDGFLGGFNPLNKMDSRTWNPLAVMMVGGESWVKFNRYCEDLMEEQGIYGLEFLPETVVGLLSFAMLFTIRTIVLKAPIVGPGYARWEAEGEALVRLKFVETRDAVMAAAGEGRLDTTRTVAGGEALGAMQADGNRPVLDSSGRVRDPVLNPDGTVKCNAAGKPIYKEYYPFSKTVRKTVVGKFGGPSPQARVKSAADAQGRFSGMIQAEPSNLDASRKVFEAREMKAELKAKFDAAPETLTPDEWSEIDRIIESKVDRDQELSVKENQRFIEKKFASLKDVRAGEILAGAERVTMGTDDVVKLMEAYWEQGTKPKGQPTSIMVQSDLGGTGKTWLVMKAMWDTLATGVLPNGDSLASRFRPEQLDFFNNKLVLLNADVNNTFTSKYVGAMENIIKQWTVYTRNMAKPENGGRFVSFFIDELGIALMKRMGGGESTLGDVTMSATGSGDISITGTMSKENTGDALTKLGQLLRRYFQLDVGDKSDAEVFKSLKGMLQKYARERKFDPTLLTDDVAVTAFMKEVRKLALQRYRMVADPARSENFLTDYFLKDSGARAANLSGENPLSKAQLLRFMSTEPMKGITEDVNAVRKLKEAIDARFPEYKLTEEVVRIKRTNPSYNFDFAAAEDNLQRILKLDPNGTRDSVQHYYDVQKTKACLQLLMEEMASLGGDPIAIRNFTRKWMLFLQEGPKVFREKIVTNSSGRASQKQTQELSYEFCYDTETMEKTTISQAKIQRVIDDFITKNKVPAAEVSGVKDRLKRIMDSFDALPEEVADDRAALREEFVKALQENWRGASNPLEVVDSLEAGAVEEIGKAMQKVDAIRADIAARAAHAIWHDSVPARTAGGQPTASLKAYLEGMGASPDVKTQAATWLEAKCAAGETFADANAVLERWRVDSRSSSLPAELQAFAKVFDRLRKAGVQNLPEIKRIMGISDPAAREAAIGVHEARARARSGTASLYREGLDAPPVDDSVRGQFRRGLPKGNENLFGEGSESQSSEWPQKPAWQQSHDDNLAAFQQSQGDAALNDQVLVADEAAAHAADNAPALPAANAAAVTTPPSGNVTPPVVNPNPAPVVAEGGLAAGAAIVAKEVLPDPVNPDPTALVMDDEGKVIGETRAGVSEDTHTVFVMGDITGDGEIIGETRGVVEADLVLEMGETDGVVAVDGAPVPRPLAARGALFVGEHGSNLAAGVAGGVVAEAGLRGVEELTGVKAPEAVHFAVGLTGGTEASHLAAKGWMRYALGDAAGAAKITRAMTYGSAIAGLPYFMAGDYLAKEAAIGMGIVDRGGYGEVAVGMAGGMATSSAAMWALARMGLNVAKVTPWTYAAMLLVKPSSTQTGEQETKALFDYDVLEANKILAKYNSENGLEGSASALGYEKLVTIMANWGMPYRDDCSLRNQPLHETIMMVAQSLQDIDELREQAFLAADYLSCSTTDAVAKSKMKADYPNLTAAKIELAFAATSDFNGAVARLFSTKVNGKSIRDQIAYMIGRFPDAVSRSTARVLLSTIVGPVVLGDIDQGMLTLNEDDPRDEQFYETALAGAFSGYLHDNEDDYTYYASLLQQSTDLREADLDGDGAIDDAEQIGFDQANESLRHSSSQSTSRPEAEDGESVPDEDDEAAIDEAQRLYDEFYEDVYSKDES